MSGSPTNVDLPDEEENIQAPIEVIGSPAGRLLVDDLSEESSEETERAQYILQVYQVSRKAR